MAWLMPLIPVVGVLVDAAAIAPVVPWDLPAEYVRGVDGRVPYINFRQMEHLCSYHDDPFSCANLSPVKYTKIRDISDPFEPMREEWHRGTCGECLNKSKGFPPAGTGSVATFCSKESVNGKWLMLNVVYGDESCKEVRGYGKPIEIPGATPPADCLSGGYLSSCLPGTDCWSKLRHNLIPLEKCPPTVPGLCGPSAVGSCSDMTDPASCAEEGPCTWAPFHPPERKNAFQFYYTLEKPFVPPTPAPVPPTPGCTIEGPSYTIDAWSGAWHCAIGAGPLDDRKHWPLKGVKDVAACASECKKHVDYYGAPDCVAFHYYGADDPVPWAIGNCFLQKCIGTINGPLHDGRDRYVGTCNKTLSNGPAVQFV